MIKNKEIIGQGAEGNNNQIIKSQPKIEISKPNKAITPAAIHGIIVDVAIA